MAEKRKLKKPVKITLWLIAICMIAAAGWTAVRVHREQERKKEAQEIYDSFVMNIDETALRIDAGTAFDIRSAVQYSGGELETEGVLNTDETGSYPLVLTLRRDTSYGETVSREYPVTVEVIDNTVPEITLASDVMEVHAGSDDVDLNSNVTLVTDGKDGDLSYSETEAPGTYRITTDADLETDGEYNVTVSALDTDGHHASAEFRLVVTAADVYTNPYRIRINRELNTVTVYAADAEGNYTIPLKAMVCSTGPATPVGVFHTFNRSTWRALFGGVYGQYATDIVGDILFHSVPYYSMNKGDVEYLEYNKLGTKASMGCIRLPVIDALWIFQNCPIGTEVEIYDDPNNPGPLGKPESIYIDPESEIRGWDPTDPDPANPWNY